MPASGNLSCRLFVYLAREAPVGVVLRRGPSAWTRLSFWHIDTDTFEHGQWFRGRVYERRSDLSPDGSLFVYFARKSGSRVPAEDTWVAVSRPPWFTALALWFVGGTYWPGGFFPARHSLFVGGPTGRPDQGDLPEWLTLTNDIAYRSRSNNWTERTVYFSRLLRDGWTAVPGAEAERARWERHSPNGGATLVMLPKSDRDYRAHGGPHVVEYAVRSDAGVERLGRLTWADWDQRGRLILARDGRLEQWLRPGEVGLLEDFNRQRPEAAPSPPAARSWPVSPVRA